MEQEATAVVGGLILAGIIWIATTVQSLSKEVAVLKAILVGTDGNNGVKSEVHAVRKRQHEHANEIHAIKGKQELHELRLNNLEPS
jgi:hypothetical protein